MGRTGHERPARNLSARARQLTPQATTEMPDRTPQPIARAFAALLAALFAAALLAVPASAQVPAPVQPIQLPTQPAPTGTGFDGNGMWIWELSHSTGGNLDAIAARARAAGVTTLFIKSSDGTGTWRQFNSRLVQSLHARGLKACAWGYVYGSRPTSEARAARYALRSGADCFVIDAESEYEGKYVSASTYMGKLRAYAGPDYPIGLAGFPYVHYHPAFPYSVFLGLGGAQFNLPQMYWRAIGTTVDNVFATTYTYNTPYGRPVYPLGQTYGGVSSRQIVRFRQFAQAYGAPGVSWWSWQSTPYSRWGALAEELAVLPASRAVLPAATTLSHGMRGDLVVWAQQLLMGAGEHVRPHGKLDSRTRTAIKLFQRANGLPVTGAVDPTTWASLLAHPAAKIRWRRGGTFASSAGAASAPPPVSARIPAKRDELRAAPH